MDIPFDFNTKIYFVPKITNLLNTEFERYYIHVYLDCVTATGKSSFYLSSFNPEP